MTSKEFAKIMEKLSKAKKKELDKRGRKSRYLRTRADEAYEKKNIEMWEAYEESIQEHQEKMIVLICEIGKIQQFFDSLAKLQKGFYI